MEGGITKVAIVTPVHNRRELTLLCLRSLSRIRAGDLEITTFIVDDGSTDGTAEAVRNEFPEVKIVPGTGDLWFTEGTNVGVRAALENDPDFVLMINDDSVFDSRFLEHLVETARTHPRSVVGPLLLLWDTPHRIFQVSPKWDLWAGGWRHWNEQTVWTVPGRPWEVDLIVGNCVLVPAEAIRENGLMDSKRFPNFGDAEYTPRLKKRGWKLLIDPRARVFCQPNALPARVREMGVGKRVRNLIIDLGHPHNLRRRFYAGLYGAPNRIEGVLAFFVFLLRAATGTSPESERARSTGERPLAEIFADDVVD